MPLDQALADGRSAQPSQQPPTVIGGTVNLGPSSDPTTAMAGARDGEQLKAITLPSFGIPYRMTIGIADYQRSSWEQIGDLSPIAKIALPLPIKIVDRQQVLWDAQSLGAFGPMVGGSPVTRALGGDFSGAAGALTGSAIAAGVGLTSAVGGQIADAGLGAIQASIGVAVNNFLTIMLKGPAYKTHTFTWKISPTTAADSEKLSNVYKILSSAGSVSLASYTGSAFFNYPKIFQLNFEHSGDQAFGFKRLFQFKKSVLTSATWDFTPMNSPAFYGKTKAPESVEFTLEFTELEYWLANDYSTEGGYGVQTTANPAVAGAIEAIVGGIDSVRSYLEGGGR